MFPRPENKQIGEVSKGRGVFSTGLSETNLQQEKEKSGIFQ